MSSNESTTKNKIEPNLEEKDPENPLPASHEQEENPTTKSNSQDDNTVEEQPQRDEEGLLYEYDVIICGTGLVQSILASAFTRACKSVLHVDGHDFYGELDTVWNLSQLQELYNNHRFRQQATNSNIVNDSIEFSNDTNIDSTTATTTTTPSTTYNIPLSRLGSLTKFQCHSMNITRWFGIQIGTKVQTPYGNGIVKAIVRESNENNEQSSLSTSITNIRIELSGWKLTNGQSPIVHIAIPNNDNTTTITTPIELEQYLHNKHGIRSILAVRAEELLIKQERYFAFDATPAFILASGIAVQGMLTSGVADYLEFKSVEGLYWLESKQGTKREARTTPSFELFRVPCSKNDIFNTKLLQPMDKRRLMKFIQLSLDYATKMSILEEEEESLSSQENKIINDDSSLSHNDVQSLNERHLNQGRSLARPQNKAVATDELTILQECITADQSMAFDDFLLQEYKLSDKLRSLVRYALAWEITETSTSLAHGMSSLRKHLQALGRYGTTAFLFPLYGSGELSQAFCRSAAVFGATYLLRRTPLAIQVSDSKNDEEENDGTIVEQVQAVILEGDTTTTETLIEDSKEKLQHKRKIIKCSNLIVPAVAIVDKVGNYECESSINVDRIVRRISILSGKIITSTNAEQRHVIFIPPNMVGNSHVIHGVILDDSVSVAPEGCTVLHLTTTISIPKDSVDNEELGNCTDLILEKAQHEIMKSNGIDDRPIELCCFSFSHSNYSRGAEASSSRACPRGVYLCEHSGQALAADGAFEQAYKIFSSICPNMKFLGLSTSFDETIRERAEEKRYDDDEKVMLESALGMIDERSSI